MSKQIVHGLWIGKKLSPIEQLCVASFMKNGYEFQLWCYEKIDNIPNGCVLKNANEIIPYEDVFCYENESSIGVGKGSYAGFSDLFRYKLLYELGGLWVDMDVTCIAPITIKGEYLFRFHHKLGAVGNIMYCPPKSEIMFACYKRAKAEISADNVDWLKPIVILNEAIAAFKLTHCVQQMSNDDSFPIVAKMLSSNKKIPQYWQAIHWMNEEFRRLDLPKNSFLKESVIGAFLSKYEIDFFEIKGINALIYSAKTSRIRYLWINAKKIIFNFLKV